MLFLSFKLLFTFFFFIFQSIRMVLEINDSNFKQEVENYEGVAIVDFWAPWCGACVASTPAVEAVSSDLKDKAKFLKLNVDENQEVASRFGVMSIPTFIFFRNGKEEERKVGMQTPEIIKGAIEGLLKK